MGAVASPRKDIGRFMSQYRGRHSARHAKPRTSRVAAVGLGLRRPAVSASLALAFVASGAAGVSAHESATTEPAVFTLSPLALVPSDLTSASADRTRVAADHSAVNTQKAAVAAQADADARARVEAEAQARTEEADRAAREAARVDLIANAVANPQAATQALMGEFGFGPDQWSCLNNLVIGESTWNYRATNPSSGAYGLFQSLPANKMDSVATDWADNPITQIRWGLDYIKRSYGTPCGAWGAWQSRYPHWY